MYNFFPQIEDLSQQAQVAAAEKFKEPPVIPATEAGGSTTVKYNIFIWKRNRNNVMYYLTLFLRYTRLLPLYKKNRKRKWTRQAWRRRMSIW